MSNAIHRSNFSVNAGFAFPPRRRQSGGVDRLEQIDEAEEWLDGYGYRHLFLRTPIR
jgi:hypothetical protein